MIMVLRDLRRRPIPTTATTDRPRRRWQNADHDIAVRLPIGLTRVSLRRHVQDNCLRQIGGRNARIQCPAREISGSGNKQIMKLEIRIPSSQQLGETGAQVLAHKTLMNRWPCFLVRLGMLSNDFCL